MDVLYVDLPTGQVSFHAYGPSENRREYDGKWDGTGLSEERIVKYCDLQIRVGQQVSHNTPSQI